MKGSSRSSCPCSSLLAVGGGGAYFFVLAPKPAKAAPAEDRRARSFPLSPEFVVNLSGGHYGKVTVALLHDRRRPAAPAERRRRPPLTEDAAVRAIVTERPHRACPTAR